jgi:hypothetical protein
MNRLRDNSILFGYIRGNMLRLFLILLILPALVIASPPDSLQNRITYPTVVKYFFEKDFLRGNTVFYSPDSSVGDIDKVHPALDNHHNFLGTAGSASNPQIFGANSSPYTFTGVRSFDLQLLESDDIRYFRTNKRFSEIHYHSGNFKEQRIAILHSQNITSNWSAGIYFDRQGVKEYMNFSNTFRSRFALYSWYHTQNKKYNLFVHAIWNTIKNGVNGGLSNDSLFDNTSVTNLGIKGLAYRLSGAEQHQRKRILQLSHYYDLKKAVDTSAGLQILHSTANAPFVRLHHKFTHERKSFTYLDPAADSAFYENFYYSDITYDSLFTDETKNRFAIQIPADTSYRSKFFKFCSSGIFAEFQNVNYGQREDSSWENLSVGGNLSYGSDSVFPEVNAEGSYVISGFDDGNYSVDARASSGVFSFGTIGVLLQTTRTSADLNFRWYESNNFIWKNSFLPIKTFTTGIFYEWEKYDFKIEAKKIKVDNYVYLNNFALPDQYNNSLLVNQLTIIKNFTYRHWHLNNFILLQETDRKGVIHIPGTVSTHSLYHEKYYYNKKLLAAVGTTLNYNSNYFADDFMPSNAMFFLQNDVQTGGYLRFDLFFNLKIKSAGIFLRVENLLDDVIDRSYYLTPHYPMPGRVIKFGVVWRFFDQ